MSEWRTIEGAPEGTQILVFTEGKHTVVAKRFRDSWTTAPGAWTCYPTHWMPLPAPPESQPSEGELEAAGQTSLLA